MQKNGFHFESRILPFYTSAYAFKFDCVRYLQHENAISEYLKSEAERFGTKAFIICGENGYRAAHSKIENALEQSKIKYYFSIFKSTCCIENADDLAKEIKNGGYDLVIGVGGGVFMDQAKLTAARAGTRLIQIPTSSATCAAVTPLSVTYSRDTGATIGSIKLMTEADAVIVDLGILIKQPQRLFGAGIMDAKAKKIEIEHRHLKMNGNKHLLGFDYAYHISKILFEQLEELVTGALESMKTGTVTDSFEKLIFAAIAITGIVSGICKGSNQCAIAHKFYEECRSFFYENTLNFLHGELVAVGLLVRLSYFGSDCAYMINELTTLKLPKCLSELNIPTDAVEKFADELCNSSAINDTSDISRKRMLDALEIIKK